VVAMAASLSCRVSAISAFCQLTTQAPMNSSISNRLVAIFHTKLIIAILVPKLVAMATSLGPLISAMSSLDSFIPKTGPSAVVRNHVSAVSG